MLSPGGKEAIISVLQPGDFFAEGCLAGQQVHIATAMALNASTVAVIDKKHMFEMLHTQPELNEQFLTHMLKRNIRIEEDIIDQLFNSVEKRLARTLLLLARYGTEDGFPRRVVPSLSQEALAEIVGTTRSRVSFFMNKFQEAGLYRLPLTMAEPSQAYAAERRAAFLMPRFAYLSSRRDVSASTASIRFRSVVSVVIVSLISSATARRPFSADTRDSSAVLRTRLATWRSELVLLTYGFGFG